MTDLLWGSKRKRALAGTLCVLTLSTFLATKPSGSPSVKTLFYNDVGAVRPAAVGIVSHAERVHWGLNAGIFAGADEVSAGGLAGAIATANLLENSVQGGVVAIAKETDKALQAGLYTQAEGETLAVGGFNNSRGGSTIQLGAIDNAKISGDGDFILQVGALTRVSPKICDWTRSPTLTRVGVGPAFCGNPHADVSQVGVVTYAAIERDHGWRKRDGRAPSGYGGVGCLRQFGLVNLVKGPDGWSGMIGYNRFCEED